MVYCWFSLHFGISHHISSKTSIVKLETLRSPLATCCGASYGTIVPSQQAAPLRFLLESYPNPQSDRHSSPRKASCCGATSGTEVAGRLDAVPPTLRYDIRTPSSPPAPKPSPLWGEKKSYRHVCVAWPPQLKLTIKYLFLVPVLRIPQSQWYPGIP